MRANMKTSFIHYFGPVTLSYVAKNFEIGHSKKTSVTVKVAIF
jgi:hypothetical protein